MFLPLVEWSLANYSHLPWRKNRTLYRTLVSEIMLQQTTVPTVLNYFEPFLKKYPLLSKLAQTGHEELMLSWKGLGYYRRANNLLKATQYMMDHHQGKIPLDREALLAIPGIGPYTAHALLGIGDNRPYLAIDANLERVLSRLFLLPEIQGKKLQTSIEKLFLTDVKLKKELIQIGGTKFNEALMDLGRELCRSKNPQCHLCPIAKKCQAFLQKKVELYPAKKETTLSSTPSNIELHLFRFLVRSGKKVLCYQKGDKEWLSGQWELPTFIWKCEDRSLKQYPWLKKELRDQISSQTLLSYKTAITKYRITNHLISLSEKEFFQLNQKGEWLFRECNIEKENFSTATIKALKLNEKKRAERGR